MTTYSLFLDDDTVASATEVVGPAGGSFLQSGTGAVSRSAQAKMRDQGAPEDFGAVGDGTTDDTAAFTAALAACRTLTLSKGKTYLLNGSSSSLSNQTIIAHGATVKLKNSATTGHLLTMSGDDCMIVGGTWDGNRANQSGSSFSFSNIRFTGDNIEITGTLVKDCYGLGIYGTGGDAPNIHHNKLRDNRAYGIYVEHTTADTEGASINNNTVTNSADTIACGIYLTGMNDPFTYKQKDWDVSNNRVKGMTASPTGVGITVRGVDGVCSNNRTYGFAMGISCDLTSDSTITGNRCYSPGGTGYCIEVNCGGNVIANNKTRGGVYGIISSQAYASFPMDRNVIANNNIQDPSSHGIVLQAAIGSASGLHCQITGNVIQRSSGAGHAIRAAGTCQYLTISNNTLIGPGSGTANTRAVYLDAVNSNVLITGNLLSGWERAVTCYNNTATAYTDIAFHNNDCKNDVLGTPTFLVADGTATIGARCSMLWNKQSTTGSNHKHMFDMLNNRYLEFNNSYATPESNVSAGIGSLFVNTNGGAGTTMFVKESGTGNTGWAGK